MFEMFMNLAVEMGSMGTFGSIMLMVMTASGIGAISMAIAFGLDKLLTTIETLTNVSNDNEIEYVVIEK